MKRKSFTIITLVAIITAAFFMGRMSATDGHDNGNYIPVSDISCQYTDSDGYTAVELKDFSRMYDDPKGKSYSEILSSVPDETQEYIKNTLDLDSVTNVEVTDDQVIIEANEGNLYILDIN